MGQGANSYALLPPESDCARIPFLFLKIKEGIQGAVITVLVRVAPAPHPYSCFFKDAGQGANS
ncbi:MAG: hypothetical protein A3J74_00100 [Elusimicrobia bacterium RIFCSPHIGHO2_02_FULL_57_9]|nr:MAG: hypothetical protein A3J74_00100 [Elusimicrobia bacterium RIFCSPHIGHO2_02_FULL_57_9]